jgi:hypothetical protein
MFWEEGRFHEPGIPAEILERGIIILRQFVRGPRPFRFGLSIDGALGYRLIHEAREFRLSVHAARPTTRR